VTPGTCGSLRRGTTDFESRFNEYLHRRLRLSAWVLGSATLVFCLNSWLTHILTGAYREAGYFDGSRVTLLAAVVVAAVFPLILHRRALSTRVLVSLDAALVWSATLVCLAYYEIGYERAPIFLVPILGLLILGRAVFVPSTATRTLLLSLPAAPALLAIQLFHGEIYTEVGVTGDPRWFVTLVTWNQVVIGLSILLATFASLVNFRLRREAFEATQIGPYVVGKKIGEGAMGEVYRAQHALLRRPTAVKVIRGGMIDDRMLARFEQEVRQTARLTHPNTIQIFDYGRTPEGTFYYAMELLDGEDLREIIERTGPMSSGRVVHVLAQACAALEEAHAIGLVHRDVKASNLILCQRGLEPDVVKVMDFGLVKDTRGDGSSKTGIGETCGTPETMAPETICGREVGPAVDLYALGAVGCYLLTARQVFDAETAIAYIGQHLRARPIPPSARGVDVPADLETLLLRCLAKEPGERPVSAAAMQEDLLACGIAGDWTVADAREWWRRWRVESEPT